jgi:hypothetical protein
MLAFCEARFRVRLLPLLRAALNECLQRVGCT